MPTNARESLLISVVIPTRNRCTLVQEAVEALWRQTLPAPRWEIIVVDNCSTDDTGECVRAMQQRSPCDLHYLRMPRDGGPAGARNAGATRGAGRYIVFMDSDVVLDDAWLALAVEHADADPRIGLLSGKLLYAAKPEFVNAFGGEMGRIGLAWDACERAPSSAVDRAVERLWVPMAAALVRRELFHEIGGFDPAFLYAYEDSDLGWRVNLTGFRCVCLPDLLAYHRVSDREEWLDQALIYHACKNRLRSLLSNYGWRQLVLYLPPYLAYAVIDSFARRPRRSKLRALLWNLAALPDTLRRRRIVQRQRRVTDGLLRHLFSARWFPPETVRTRHQRQHALHLGDAVETVEAKT
ncbi:MAG: glycosyltransferase family 2 protein [Planctomycetes bacterium]|nr:glycosyltransferase family 2 protein [Planctomycetota bacterium]